MGYTYKSANVTANCGNDTIGIGASGVLAQHMQDEQLDYMVINCQEVDFDKTKEDLERSLNVGGGNYKVVSSRQMVTHTDKSGDNFLTNSTGMTTFVVYNADKIEKPVLENFEEARRFQKKGFSTRLAFSGYNKGGLVSHFRIKPIGSDESIKVETVSAHLEASKPHKRNGDWYKVNKSRANLEGKNIKSWDDLAKAIPDLSMAGSDKNTRLKYAGPNNLEDPWEHANKYCEMQSLDQVRVGSNNFTVQNTYYHHKQEPSSEPSAKRPTEVNQGSLDHLEVEDGRYEPIQGQTKPVDIEAGGRDHKVLISPTVTYTKGSDYARVQGHIANRLKKIAPNLAAEIRDQMKDDTPENRTKLLAIYQKYLQKDGCLLAAMSEQSKRLKLYKELSEQYKSNPKAMEYIKHKIFVDVPWFEDVHLSNCLDKTAGKLRPLDAKAIQQDVAKVFPPLEPIQKQERKFDSFKDLFRRLSTSSQSSNISAMNNDDEISLNKDSSYKGHSDDDDEYDDDDDDQQRLNI